MAGSLRDFMMGLQKRKQLLVVKKEVDPKFELHAVVRKVQAGPNLPVLFEKVRGTRFPFVSNLLGNYGTGNAQHAFDCALPIIHRRGHVDGLRDRTTDGGRAHRFGVARGPHSYIRAKTQ